MNQRISNLLLVLLTCSGLTASAADIALSQASVNSFSMSQTSDKSIQYVVCNVGHIEANNVQTEKGKFVNLQANRMVNKGVVGQPSLPAFSELLEIPFNSTVKVSVVSYKTETFKLSSKGFSNKVYPHQNYVSKSEKATFAYNSAFYSKNAFTSAPLAEFVEEGIMRDVRYGRINVNPVRYNPATNTITVYNNMKVKIEYSKNALKSASNARKENQLTRGLVNGSMYSYRQEELETGLKYASDFEKETMLIIADKMFKSALSKFITHKQKMGLNVEVVYTDELSAVTTDAIKKRIQQSYDKPKYGKSPLYLLLVGDIDQIPSFGPYKYNNTTREYYTDLYYATLDGSDFIPDVFYGRFSANNVDELTPQIDKTIEYETYSMPDPSYLYRDVLIAGYDAGHFLEANSQMIYVDKEYGKTCNDNSILLLQTKDAGKCYTTDIVNAVNNGVGLLNYSAHGGSNCLVGQFYISDIQKLNNEHKYGLWIANCCLTNKFDDRECLGEALLRAKNKGAVGYIGASCLSLWVPDYYWAVGRRSNIKSDNPEFDAENLGVFDKLFHTKINDSKNIFTTQGAILFAGNINVESNEYYWQIYHLMGDPSVFVRFAPPAECDEDMNIVKNISDGKVHNNFKAYKSIIATNTISNKSTVKMGANYSVRLLKGFKVSAGSSFLASLNGCTSGNNNAMRSAKIMDIIDDEVNENTSMYNDDICTISPNPTDGIFNVSMNNDNLSFNVRIVGVTGQLMKSYYGVNGQVECDITDLPAGIYFVQINERFTTKVVKN